MSIGANGPVVLLKGADAVTLGEAASEVLTELVGDADRTEVVDEFSGDEYSLGAVVMAANSVSMFGERVVVARNCGRFPAAEQAAIIDYLQSPNPTSTLLLVWDRPLAAGTQSQAVSRKLGDAVKAACGTVRACDPPTQAKARASWIDARIAHAGVRLDPGARRLLVERLGEDSRVDGVLDVLVSTFGTGSTLGAEQIEPYLGEPGGVPPWDLTDAIDRGDVGRSVELARRMMTGGGRHPLQVLATLQSHVERMLRLDGAGVRNEQDAAALLGMKGSTFPAKKALEASRRVGSERIARGVVLVAAADLDLKGAVDWPPHLVIEVLVGRLARTFGGARRR